MSLTLEISGPVPADTSALRKVFDESGGTIGRHPSNDWVLPDKFVSSQHARITFSSGEYQIEDLSRNGTFLNALDNPLTPGQPTTIRTGDRVFIDPYQIQVTVSSGASAHSAPRPVPTFDDDPFGQVTPPPSLSHPSALLPADPQHPDVDPMEALGFPPRGPAPSAPRAENLALGSILNDHYQPPLVPAAPLPPPPPSAGPIPEDYDPLMPPSHPGGHRSGVPLASPPAKVAAPVRPVAPAPGPTGAVPSTGARPVPSLPPRDPMAVDLSDVLEGAGLIGVQASPDLARDFGEILRIVVSGMMDVLRARQRIKEEFGMRVTSLTAAQNNPLKFSANLDDALHNLLVRRNAAYLGPVEAFADAFDDVRNHQMAILAGIRVAFESMLKTFDPDVLQQEFDHGVKGSFLSRQRYWEQYRAKFSDMVSDVDGSFRELFGNEFAKAYEKQLELLKEHDRPRRRS